jgi:digeranylgeranylglycerophospholipid reductase
MADYQQWTCDVLVIGAGPAGSTAARIAAQKGVKVLLLERRERVGLPVRCAEYVPLPVSRYVDLKPSGILAQPVHSMQTYIEGKLANEMTAPGLMIHRHRLDQHLADQAVKAGAVLKTGFQACTVNDGQVVAREDGGWVKISCQIIIGADGPSSQVSRWMINPSQDYLIAAQFRVPLTHSLEQTRVFFRPYLFGGYGWIFPKGETANLGVGIDPSLKERLPEVLNRFKEERLAEGLIENEILNRGGGLVPVGGVTRVWKENMILAGDAAGTCHPITGAGVGNAIISGEMAGEAAAEAVSRGNLQPLLDYGEDLVGHLGHSLSHAVRKRKEMIAQWNNGNFSENIRHNWIAFKEYLK